MADSERHFNELVVLAQRAVGPLANYADLDPATLAKVHLVNRLWKIQGSFMALNRLYATLVDQGHLSSAPDIGFLDIVDFAGKLRIDDVRRVRTPRTGDDLGAMLIGLIIEEEWIVKTFAERLLDRPVSRTKLLLDNKQEVSLNDFLKALGVDKVRSWTEGAVTADDLKATACISALDAWRAQKAKIVVESEPYPPLKVRMTPTEKQFEGRYVARAWENGQADILGDSLATLTIDEKIIRWAAYDKQREENRRELRRATVLSNNTGQIADEIHGGGPKSPSLVVCDKRTILARATAKWGAKVAQAVEYRLEGKTEKEAAKMAGIPLNTLKSCVFRLKKEFSKKT